MATPEDEDAIEAVAADGAHPALAERVRVRRWTGVRLSGPVPAE
jgi:hypothetical protein